MGNGQVKGKFFPYLEEDGKQGRRIYPAGEPKEDTITRDDEPFFFNKFQYVPGEVHLQGGSDRGRLR